jgi:predicted XRE-type DNA-binding protein
MGFPSEKELARVRKLLATKEGTLLLHENATPLERFRWDICQLFVKYLRKNDLTQKDLAELLGIDAPKMSKILRHRIDEFSTDRLIELYAKINPELKLKVS